MNREDGIPKPIIGGRIDAEEKRAIEDWGRRRGLTVSFLVVQGLREFIERHDDDPTFPVTLIHRGD